jgi:RNA-dependent RNA polymerase
LEEIGDLGEKPYYYTDGVGTISRELGDMIWAELCKVRRDHGARSVPPSAYQIRFLGYKGMVAIDEELPGIKMCLRPSMRKFTGRDGEFAEIEIARAFDRPNYSYLNRPMVMILEDRGVKRQSFMSLQNSAVANTRTIHDSLAQFRHVLRLHSLGTSYRLSFIIERLVGLGLDINTKDPEKRLDNAFFARLRDFAMTHVLRDIKHSARIPIPNSYLLVGVADEGPAYVGKGYENVYILPEGKIFACVQETPDDKPKWLRGSCTISRSPLVHPGDIQRVFAIGEPPKDKLCLFKNLKNCVVLPSTATTGRSLCSCLGGGDLDGDLYDIVFHAPLLPTEEVKPAEYPPGEVRETDGGRPSTVDDICDFIVEYISSDILGLLSDKHLTIADQSKYGTSDTHCLKLAELCSQAVDYPKNGIPVDMERVPRFLIPYKPDWHAAEVAAPRRTDYYESDRALGHLYRAIEIEDPAAFFTRNLQTTSAPLTDPISVALKWRIQEHFPNYTEPDGKCFEISRLFQTYVDELSYICLTHTLTSASDVRLHEEEVVVGTILAKCSQRRLRKDRMHRVRTHSQVIVHEIQREFVGDLENASKDEIRASLVKAWAAWDFSLRNSPSFGANSFGLIALGIIFDCLDKLEYNTYL